MTGETRLAPVVTIAAAVLTATAVVLPPVTYFLLSYHHVAGSVEAEAEINARAVAQIVGKDPDLWKYEEARLSEYLARRPRAGVPELRRVLDERGAVVAESADVLMSPRITRSVPVFDAGMPVGTIEISRSLRPLLVRSGVLALVLIVVGALSFGAVRTLPLRVIRRGEQARLRLEERLRHAEKLEAIGQLAGGIAHDFNNILSVVKGYGVLLRRSLPEGGHERRWVEAILATTDRATSLTAGLLTFGGRQVLRSEPVDLAGFLRRSEASLRRIARERVDVRIETPPEPLPAMADPLQIERVLLNLVANARDAMPEGGSVVIAASRVDLDPGAAAEAGVDAPGPHARITVSDTGPGIDPGLRARIFEPFFTTKGEEGTGLGLSIVHGIVKQHRGSIRLDGEGGKGATFTLLLPLLGYSAVLEADREAAAHSRGSETLRSVLDAPDPASAPGAPGGRP